MVNLSQGVNSFLAYHFQTWTVSILPPHRQIKSFQNGKVLPRCGRKKAPSDLVTFSLSLSPFRVFVFALLVCFAFMFRVSLVLCFALFNMFLFVYFQFCFILFFIKIKKKIEKLEKYKNSVCFVYIGTCVPWMAIETKFNFVSFVAWMSTSMHN